MALITRSIEMSFSASRLRRTATSMSIRSLLVRCWSWATIPRSPSRAAGTGIPQIASAVRLVGVPVRQAAELYLYSAWSERRVTQHAPRAVDLERDAFLISVDHAPGLRALTSWCVRFRLMIRVGQRHGDQPADRATPVPRLRQRPVHP